MITRQGPKTNKDFENSLEFQRELVSMLKVDNAALRAEVAQLTRDLRIEHDKVIGAQSLKRQAEFSLGLAQKKSERLEARVKRYRESLEHIAGNRGNLQECCRKAFQEDQLDNHDAEIADKPLADEPPGEAK